MKPGPSNAWRVALVATFVGFLYLALRPSVVTPPVGYDDEVAHALVNFALGLMVYKSFAPGRPLTLGLIALVLCGGGVEIAQTWAPTRAPSWPDFFANLVGVAGAAVVSLMAALRWRRRRAPEA